MQDSLSNADEATDSAGLAGLRSSGSMLCSPVRSSVGQAALDEPRGIRDRRSKLQEVEAGTTGPTSKVTARMCKVLRHVLRNRLRLVSRWCSADVAACFPDVVVASEVPWGKHGELADGCSVTVPRTQFSRSIDCSEHKVYPDTRSCLALFRRVLTILPSSQAARPCWITSCSGFTVAMKSCPRRKLRITACY